MSCWIWAIVACERRRRSSLEQDYVQSSCDREILYSSLVVANVSVVAVFLCLHRDPFPAQVDTPEPAE